MSTIDKQLEDKALELRREYQREYRRKNRERINQQQREWIKANPDRKREHNRRYWERKALKELKENEGA